MLCILKGKANYRTRFSALAASFDDQRFVTFLVFPQQERLFNLALIHRFALFDTLFRVTFCMSVTLFGATFSVSVTLFGATFDCKGI